MTDVPITRLEAQLEVTGTMRGVIVPPMPVRRRVSIEEFEADMRAINWRAGRTVSGDMM